MKGSWGDDRESLDPTGPYRRSDAGLRGRHRELADLGHLVREGACTLICRILERVLYPHLGKADQRGWSSGSSSRRRRLSRAPITRLVGPHRRTGGLRDHRNKPPAQPFPRRNTPQDIASLAGVDEAFGRLSGPVTQGDPAADA